MLAICTFPLSPCQLSCSVRMGISTLGKGRAVYYSEPPPSGPSGRCMGWLTCCGASNQPPRPFPLIPLPLYPPPSSAPLLPPAPGAWQLPVSTASGRRGASSARTVVTHLQSETRTCTSYKASSSIPLPGCVAAAKSLSLYEPQWPCLRNGCLGNLGKSTSLLASAPSVSEMLATAVGSRGSPARRSLLSPRYRCGPWRRKMKPAALGNSGAEMGAPR